MENGNIDSVEIYDSEESTYNWVRNFVYENFEANGYLEDIKDVTDPYELLHEFNNRWTPDYVILLKGPYKLSPPVKLDKSIELLINVKKYNL